MAVLLSRFCDNSFFRFENTEHHVASHFRLNVYVFIVFGWFCFYVILRHATKKPLFSVEGVVVPRYNRERLEDPHRQIFSQ